jgi:outer membrane receptor protein involved in Fe transport
VRGEYSDITMRQKTTGTVTPNRYSDFYPTLHTAYRFNERHEMQLNYSMRINRPEGDDLNPFPEWRDPLSVSTGNPLLLPEKIHSVEMGYMFREDLHTLMATVYHRYMFNRMTEVTEYGYNGNAEILWTRKENLSSSQSFGMEFIVSSGIGKAVRFNLSSNVFYNIIDARSLGYSEKKSTVAWNAALNANFNISRNLLAQLNTRYTAKSLTPQGYREPSFIMNLGARYDIFKKKASLMFTVSDLFNSFKQVNVIDRPELLGQVGKLDDKEVLVKQRVERKRPSQIGYIGFVYHFGKTPKNTKEPALKYDEGF